MTKRVSLEHSAMAVVFYNGRVLATHEDVYGKVVLSLPKGHIEAGETTTEAAIRECFEETNVIITKTDAVAELETFEYSFKRPDGKETLKKISPILFITKYKCNPCSMEKRIKSVDYMDVEQFLDECVYENVKSVVRSALQRLRNG